jgi:hypothetical protein
MIKRQFAELVTEEAVEFTAERAMQRGTCETGVITPGVIGRARILLVLRHTATRQYLLRSQRLQSVIVRIAQIQTQVQFAR